MFGLAVANQKLTPSRAPELKGILGQPTRGTENRPEDSLYAVVKHRLKSLASPPGADLGMQDLPAFVWMLHDFNDSS
jgi:hypothetical protein